MHFDALTLAAITVELRATIDNGRVQQILMVDGHSVERMRDGGCEPAAALTAADAGNALALSGDLIHTGPTGTNVMDLCIGLKRH